jgi:hypothetical protein
MSTISKSVLWILVSALALGCGDDASQSPDAPVADGPSGPATLRFAPSTGAMAFGDVPYPGDLYRMSSGGIQISQLPIGANVLQGAIDMTNIDLAQDHGFGQTTAIFFAVDNAHALDAAAVQGATHLVDLADGSELGLLTTFVAASGRICAQPLLPLKAGHAYGAWIDVALGLASTPAFDAAKAPATPSDAAQAKAHDSLAPLWATVQRDKAAVATVFTTHDNHDALVKLKQVVDAQAAPVARNVTVISGQSGLDTAFGIAGAPMLPGLDNPGVGTPRGVLHSHIAYVVHGIFDAPSFITATTDVGLNGYFALDGTGAPTVKGQQAIHFTLVIPSRTVPLDASNPLPIALFVPGLSQPRHVGYALADGLAERGIGMLSIELLFHGDRNHSARDFNNNTSGALVPDGIGDDLGQTPALQYLAAAAQGPGTYAFDAALARDDLRQSIADWWMLSRFARQGDFTAIQAADAGLATLTLRRDRLPAIAVKLAMPTLLVAASLDPNLTALAGSQPAGGMLYPFFLYSPVYAVQFIPIFGSLYNVEAELGAHPELHPITSIYQQIYEPADPLALLSGPPGQHTFFVQPFGDEEAANQSEELVERIMGIPALGGGNYRYQPLMTGSLPATGNVTTSSGALTMGVVAYMPATWDLLLKRQAIEAYMPDFPPFTPYPGSGMTITNDIQNAHNQLMTFIQTHFESTDGIPTIPAKQ